LVLLYLASTVIAASFLGRGPALLTSILSVLAFDFFLIPPYLTFAISDTQYLITFIGLFAVSFVISSLTARSKEQAEFSIQRESQTSALYSLARDLTSATDLQQVVSIIISQISQVFVCEAAIFLPENGLLGSYASTSNYYPDENEQAVAAWSFEHGQQAGPGTDTLPSASLRCQPLITSRGRIGVLGIHSNDSGISFTPDQKQAFVAFAHQAAVAIERALFAEQARDAEILQATEKLQSALLNSISHDLRTPLASITGALSSLQEKTLTINQKDRNSLIETAREEAERLNRLVENLLNMTRLEAGAIHLRKEPYDIQDVIGSSLEQIGERLDNRKVKINIQPDLPHIPLDFTLFGQVLVNLLDNAVKYSAEDTLIEINVNQKDDSVVIEICDRGVGIPPSDLERVFDKFYRVQRPENISGTGLGLTICKGIIEIHGGTIKASNRPGGGTIVTVMLPKEE
jgi:two-component system sensor histidine kinase KdpD